MSKSTNKARYIQLVEWLSTRPKQKRKSNNPFQNLSRLENYKAKGVR